MGIMRRKYEFSFYTIEMLPKQRSKHFPFQGVNVNGKLKAAFSDPLLVWGLKSNYKFIDEMLLP